MNTLKHILTLAALLVGAESMVAQKASPKWLTAEPKENEAVACAETRDAAVVQAMGLYYDRMEWTVDSTSLLAALQLLDSTLTVDQRSAWLESVSGAAFVKDSLLTDSAYWVRLVVDKEELQRAEEQRRMSAMLQASEFLVRAHLCREQGILIGAAMEYAKGLSALLPFVNRPMTSDLLEGKDLGVVLLNEYLSIFDGITMEALRKSIPVVSGEEVPLDVQFRLTVNGKPLVGLPVEGRVEGGKVSTSGRSDSKGLVSLHIQQAPAKNGSSALMAESGNLVALLLDNYVKPMLEKRLANVPLTAHVMLEPFDPAPTFSIEADSLDRIAADSVNLALSNLGMKPASKAAEADLVCSLAYSHERGGAVKCGNYSIAQSVCALKLNVKVRESGEELANYEVKDFHISHPDAKSDGEVHLRALQLMMRSAGEEMMNKLKSVSFDKRKVVYGKAAQQ